MRRPLVVRQTTEVEPTGYQKLAAAVIASVVVDAERGTTHPSRCRQARAWFGSRACAWWCHVGGLDVRAVRALAAERLAADEADGYNRQGLCPSLLPRPGDW
jgi:hypothetical protein